MYAFMADTHLGTKLKTDDYYKSLQLFLEHIKQHKEPCHAIFVAGDLFDHRLTTEEARFAGFFLLNLVCNYCGRNGKTHVPVYFIHGTYSHDYEQYMIYLQLLREINNVEVFYTQTPCIMELANGKRVLCLPQIYGDFDYAPYFEHEYDIIIGHGPLSSKTKNPCAVGNQEIMLSAETLGKISKICVFGHYHGYTDFGNNAFYAGPWLRWRYNEDEPRCFFFSNDQFEVETKPNPIAMEFKTITINDPEQLRSVISQDIKTPHRFVIKPNLEELETYHSIMTINKKNTNLTFQIQPVEAEPVVETQETATTDNSLGPIESLISYIKDKYRLDVSNEIQEYSEKIKKE